MAVLRVSGTARRRMVRLVGPFPPAPPTVAGEPARAHAVRHWDEVSRTVARAPAGPDEAIALAFAAGLGQVVTTCRRCRQVGPRDTTTPRRWLGWAMAQRPALAGLVKALTGATVDPEPAWLPRRKLPTRPRRAPTPD